MNLHKNLTKISGPPGTGKTTTLLNLLDEILSSGTSPEKVIFTTYTRAGAYEARDRAVTKFGLHQDDFKWFTTIHALCYRSIGKQKVLTRDDYKDMGEKLGLRFTYNSPYSDYQNTFNTRGDHLMAMYALSRMTCKSLAEVHRDYDSLFVPFGELKQFSEFYEKYKNHYRKIDFTDMLERFIQHGRSPEADYLIVDEAQDLCAIQWKVIQKLARTVKKVYIAGDDDQSVHVWAGADPQFLIDLEGDHEILPKSYRIPQTVHSLAMQIIERVPNRLEKPYEPRTEAGTITHHQSVDDIDFGYPGKWLVLVRNRVLAEPVFAELNRQGTPYYSVLDNSGRREPVQQAIRSWIRLVRGELISGAEAKNIYKYLKIRDRVKFGAKKVLDQSVDDSEIIDLKRLRTEYGLLCCGTWEEAFCGLHPETLAFFQAAQHRYDLSREPMVEVSTIHGAKGREADNVAVLADMTFRTWSGYRRHRDNEHRVFYVAVTRARQNLHLVRPQTNRYYEFTI